MQKFGENEKTDKSMFELQKFCDRKASAKAIPEKSFHSVLKPEFLEPSTAIASQVRGWQPLYKIEKIHTNSNYMKRKVNTNYTQSVHHIRLKPIKPRETFDLTQSHRLGKLSAWPMKRQHMEPDLLDKHVREIIEGQKESKEKTKTVIPNPVPETKNVPLGKPLAGMVAAAVPAVPVPTPPSPRATVPTVRPRTAPVHLPVFDSSSSDDSVPNCLNSSNENLADLNINAKQMEECRLIPGLQMKFDKSTRSLCNTGIILFIRWQTTSTCNSTMRYWLATKNIWKTIGLGERQIRLQQINPKRKPMKTSFKSPWSNQQHNEVHGFKMKKIQCKKEIEQTLTKLAKLNNQVAQCGEMQ